MLENGAGFPHQYAGADKNHAGTRQTSIAD